MSGERSPLRPFVLTAMFWLPAMFFLWFLLSSPVAYPVIRLADLVLSAWLPELLRDVRQEFHQLVFSYEVRIDAGQWRDAALLVEEQRVNVLLYAYGVPLFLGLVAATPLSWARTFLQAGLGLLALTLAETFGVVGNVLRTIAFGAEPAVTAGLAGTGVAPELAAAAGASAGAHVLAVLDGHGLSLDLIGLIYQFGYLMVPAVVPVVLWIAFNRRFLETLVGWGAREDTATHTPPAVAQAEPDRTTEGPSQATPDQGGQR